MAFFNFSRSKQGDSKLLKDQAAASGTAYSAYDYGQQLTNEGLGGLRNLDKSFNDRLSDPLGADVRGVFARARGELSDDAVRRQRSFASRIAQRALQSGGSMSPEALAELEQQNQRDINESLFSANNEIRGAQAELSLAETGKLFDRMTDLRKTVLGVGQDERTRGLSSILAILQQRAGRSGSYNVGFGVAGGK